MPLIKGKSKKAFESNLKAEMHAGKPQDQALAIAYNVQRQAKKKKMAAGGEVGKGPMPGFEKRYYEKAGSEGSMAKMMSKGGMIPEGSEDDMSPGMSPIRESYMSPEEQVFMANHFASGGSVADAIRMKKKMYSDGGMVDIQENGEEEGSSPYDRQNMEAVKKELYDDDQISEQPEDSNEHGDDIEEDKHDMVGAIRKKIKSKRS